MGTYPDEKCYKQNEQYIYVQFNRQKLYKNKKIKNVKSTLVANLGQSYLK